MNGPASGGKTGPVTHFTAEYYGDSFVVVHESRWGLRVAARDFETAKAIIMDGVALLQAADESAQPPSLNASRAWKLKFQMPDLMKHLVLLTPIVLVAVLLVFSVKQALNIVPQLFPSGGDVFRSLRVGTLKVDAALRDIEPHNREELLASIRSIVISLKPYADEIRPLLAEDHGKSAQEPRALPARVEQR
ncbi:MAG: hypothetical protein EKK41_27880 [Hyphomicrobiales bacterium]|nr:MAG: hypothetical protein EKK41_27880 [Hyphomicrobiales bacterium]